VIRERAWLVDYVEDRDLWRLKLPESPAVSAWIAAQPMTFESWDALHDAGLDAAIESGRAVQTYIEQYGRKARAEMTREVLRGGVHVVPCINLPYMNCSEHVGELLKEHPEAPFACGYFRRRDGRWQFSLRSRPDFDVSAVAQRFGGGGHAGAAGFDAAALGDVFAW
jgi:c-di-AMP phosphodiesterase-like protein